MTDVDVWDERVGRASTRMAVARTLDQLRETGTAVLERRDPTAATAQLRWVPRDMPMVPEWDADTAVRLGYLANVIAYRCVQIRANTIAALPFRAGPDPDKRGLWDRRAPLARFLGPAPGGPAPKLAARKLWAWTVAQRIVTGRHAWEIEVDGQGRPTAFWPLVSANLQAVPTESGSEWFRAFWYGRNDDPHRLPPDRVWYGWNPSATDFRQPESELGAARYPLSLAIMADRYGHAFLKNGAVPAAVVVTPPFPNEATKRRFQNQWNGDYRGADNAGKTAFLEATGGDGPVADAIDIKTLGLSQRDSQLILQHRDALEQVAIGLGVPWSKLDASGRTFDNAKQEDRTFYEQTILPQVAGLEDEVNMELALRVGSDAGWFDLSGVDVLRSPRFTAMEAPTLVKGGVVTVNEARAELGLDPVPGGDDLAVDVPPPAGVPDVAPPSPPGPVVEPPQDPTPDPARARRHRRRHHPAERATTVDAETRRRRAWSITDATVTLLERRWERAMRKLFARQAEATLRRLNGKRGRQSLTRADGGAVFDAEFWAAETADVAETLYDAVLGSTAARLTSQFAVSFDLAQPGVAGFVQARANQLAGQVTDTTYRQVQDAMAAGVEAGESIPDIAARIRHVFDVADQARAVTIARTEVISAYNGSSVALASQMPADVVAGQEWVATFDRRTRDDHGAADGQVVPIGEAFNVAGEALAYPGDPSGDPGNTINCRCTVAFLSPEEMPAGRSVPVSRARAVLALVQPGAGFDPHRFRRALEAA